MNMDNQDLKKRLSILESKVTTIESKFFQIDVREAVKALESYIILDVLGNKTKMLNLQIYTINNLVASKEYADSKKWKEEKHKIMFSIIEYFKNVVGMIPDGEFSKEGLALCMKQHVEDFQDDPDDAIDYNAVISEMVELLENFCMINRKPFGRGPFYVGRQS